MEDFTARAISHFFTVSDATLDRVFLIVILTQRQVVSLHGFVETSTICCCGVSEPCLCITRAKFE
jgi:hypothetical protein